MVEILLNRGVEKKRQGDMAGAKIDYYNAIRINPTEYWGYYSLENLCYLTGEAGESIFNYVRAVHLGIWNNIQNDKSGEFSFKVLKTNLIDQANQVGI